MKVSCKNSVKAAIFYLSRAKSRDINDLKRSLYLLDKNFNDKFHYPVIIFHEDFTQSLMNELHSSTRSQLHFEQVKFEVPDFLDKKDIPEYVFAGGFEFPIGYRNMCRFMSGTVYKNPSLRDYKYYWRLDTDSFILDDIDYDVFDFMEKNQLVYGYIHIMEEEPEVIVGLWEATVEYMNKNYIQPQFLDKFIRNGEWDKSYYYTNFEISNLDFWRSQEYMDYFDFLDHKGGIYKYRWGDAPIHLLGVSMLVPEEKVHKFSDIPYQHQQFINNYSVKPSMKRILKRRTVEMLTPLWKLSNVMKLRSKTYRKILNFIKK